MTKQKKSIEIIEVETEMYAETKKIVQEQTNIDYDNIDVEIVSRKKDSVSSELKDQSIIFTDLSTNIHYLLEQGKLSEIPPEN